MFSVSEYVEWYFGSIIFSPEAYAIAGAVVFIATQTIAHTLAIMSANLNSGKNLLHTLEMKPEFVFPVFALTSVAKHYFTTTAIQEGNVFKHPEMEIKGVHLVSSALPPIIINKARLVMKEIIDTIMTNKKVSLVGYLTDVANMEREIINKTLAGDVTYLRTSRIKEASSYKTPPNESPVMHHTLWEEVFQPKYGAIAPPPYGTVKIPTTLMNASALKNWLISIQDQELASRLSDWLVSHKKTSLPTMYLSEDYVSGFGIPVEIKSIINTKKILLDLLNVFRLIAETLGFFPKTDTTFMEHGY
jgi:hypothetical protein